MQREQEFFLRRSQRTMRTKSLLHPFSMFPGLYRSVEQESLLCSMLAIASQEAPCSSWGRQCLATPQNPQFHIWIPRIFKSTTNTICLGVQHWLQAEPVTAWPECTPDPPNMINEDQWELWEASLPKRCFLAVNQKADLVVYRLFVGCLETSFCPD